MRARQFPWPLQFTAPVKRNAFTDRWHGHEDELAQNAAAEGAKYRQAFLEGDPDKTAVWFGEAAGLIYAIEPAAAIVERMVADAASQLSRHSGRSILIPTCSLLVI
jgi:nitronate monooxygenase